MEIDNVVVRSSGLENFLRCERRGVAKVLYPEMENKKHVGSLVGIGAHKFVEVVINGGDEKDAAEAANEKLSDEMKDCELVVDEATLDEADVMSQAVRVGQSIANDSASRDILDDCVMEERLERALPDMGEVKVTHRGTPDGYRAADGRGKIADIKTGGLGNHWAQFGSNGLLMMKLFEVEVDEMYVIHCQRPKRSKPTPTPSIINYERPDIIIRETSLLMRNLLQCLRRVIEAGDYEQAKANTADTLCGAKYCRLHGTEFCPVTLYGGN